MEDDPTLRLTAHVDETTFAGAVRDVWHAVDGVRVAAEFPADAAPVLLVGRAADLRVLGAAVPEGVAALGKVAFRHDEGDVRAYHFLFGELTRQALAPLLEPRRAHRVVPAADAPVRAIVSAPGLEEPLEALCRDVSTSGVAVALPWEHELALSGVDRVAVTLRLPTADREVDFAGVVRNRSLGSGAIVYGIEFDGDDQRRDRRRDALAAYVEARRAALGLATLLMRTG